MNKKANNTKTTAKETEPMKNENFNARKKAAEKGAALAATKSLLSKQEQAGDILSKVMNNDPKYTTKAIQSLKIAYKEAFGKELKVNEDVSLFVNMSQRIAELETENLNLTKENEFLTKELTDRNTTIRTLIVLTAKH